MSPVPLLLALLLTAPPVEPGSPLAGCRATPIGERAWQYECEGLTARVDDLTDRKTSATLDGLQAAATARLGEGARTTLEHRRVGGEEVEVRRTQARDEHGAAWVLALSRPEGSRVLGCIAIGRAGSCAAVLDALAATPWRSGPVAGAVRQEQPSLTLGGRGVQLPAGCDGTAQPHGGGRVGCPPAYFANWARVENEEQGRLAMEQYGTAIGGKLSRPPFSARRDQVRCRLGGVETDCARMLVAAGGRRLVALWAVARLSDQLVFGSCMAEGDAPTRPPCSLIFGER